MLMPGETAIILDAGKRGSATKLVAPWKEGMKGTGEHETVSSGEEDTKGPGFVPSLLQICYTEDSVQSAKQRQLLQGFARINQVEWAHVASCNKISLPSRKRLHYPGTTLGDVIYGVTMSASKDEWHMSWGDKKLFWGRKQLIAVGGKTDVASDDKPKVRTDETMFPVCHWNMEDKFYYELMHTFSRSSS